MQVNKLKVLFLVNIPSPYRVDFFNELGKHCELTVLFEREITNERDKSWLGKDFKNFKAVFLKGKKISKNIFVCIEVINYIQKRLFDVFVIGGYSTPTGMLAIEVLKIKKIPFILNSDGGIMKIENKVKFLIKKHFISSASSWLSTGKQTNEYLVYYGAKTENIFVYPFTSLFKKDLLEDLVDQLTKERIKEKLNINQEKVILSVGRFINIKGFDILLKASTKLPREYGIYIIGGEPTQEYLSIIKKLKINNVHFVDFKTKDVLKMYYMASDIFVLPTRGDVWGLVINEAMAYGLPVVTTDKCVAGLELVKNYENGFIIPANDSDTLAKSIRIILEDNTLLKDMARNNLMKIRYYTIENMAKKTNELFNYIINKEKYKKD
ncbi:glycosyltransferase family 4 protein [Niallia sp. Krafla_26]|uniref:glycosyltransferase family 4 protein n=1 Tax=Niallia sp. Krafla_26 TaxID=3064703 RepID=UPI003D170EF5